MNSCVMQNKVSDQQDMNVTVQLDFQNCSEENEFESMTLLIPDGYKMTKFEEHGFCEYRFRFKDESIFYISTNTFSGSKLNYKNRMDNDISTYSKNRSVYDTIRNDGREYDENFWLEWINGSYTVGYVNSPDSIQFNKAIKSIKLFQ